MKQRVALAVAVALTLGFADKRPAADPHTPEMRAAAFNVPDPREPVRKARQTLGLPFDDAALIASGAAPHPESIARYGIAMTADEYTAAVQLDEWQAAAKPIHEVASRHASEMGGVYLDRAGRTFVAMVLPTTSARAKARLQRALPLGAPLRFDIVQFSTAQLDAAARQISDAMVARTNPIPSGPLHSLNVLGFSVVGAGVPFGSNRVWVSVDGLTKERCKALQRLWEERAALKLLPPWEMIAV